MASILKISRAYRGQLARKYDAVRERQERWHIENRMVAEMMEGATGSVLDVPVGTGRFLALYRQLGLAVNGADSSEEMIALARRKVRRGERTMLRVCDVLELDARLRYDSVVCVRFLNLIEEEALRSVTRRLCEIAVSRIVLTVRLGERYHSNSSMATHDERRFRALIRRLGWRAADDRTIFRKGWHVMRLERAR